MRRVPVWLVLALGMGCGAPRPVVVPEAAALKKFSPGTHRAVAKVPGVGDVKYTIAIPADYDGETRVPLVLALHYGYDGARPEPYTGAGLIGALRPGLDRLHAIVIAPDALGGDWTDARNEIAAVWLTESAMKTYAIQPRKVVVTGYSMGGEGTWFLGARHQDLFTGAIPMAAPVYDAGQPWEVPVCVIHSDADEVVSYNAARRHADRVKAQGATVEFMTARGLTHHDTGAYAGVLGEAMDWMRSRWK